jgi:hypothetical protein
MSAPPREVRRPRVVIAVTAVVLLVAAAVGARQWINREPGATPLVVKTSPAETTSPAPPTSPTAPPSTTDTPTPSQSVSPTTSPSPSASPRLSDAQAFAQLQRLRRAGLAAVVLDRRWVAQLASKAVGTTDPRQTTTTGSHTFQAPDILEEIQRVTATFHRKARIVVLLTTDYGKRELSESGQPYWVTFAVRPFRGEQDVVNWCTHQFPRLSGKALENRCAARQLLPLRS